MGTTGCGKSTIGSALADELGATFLEGDDYHPSQNKAKMSAGTPLTDEDRWPWLKTLATAMADNKGKTVASCSSLKYDYRTCIAETAKEPVLFIHLNGSKELIATRLAARKDHFMNPDLLDSQLATLEELRSDEFGLSVDIAQSVDDLLAELKAKNIL